MEKDLRIAGCYKITNIINGKVYIGESNNILVRWNQHIRDLKYNIHINQELQKDFNETYNLEYFKFEILKWFDCTDKTEPEIKALTLYLEAAYYILYKLQGYKLYNIDKCNQKNNSLFNGYCNEHDSDKVEQLINNDPFGVFSELSGKENEIAKIMFSKAIDIDQYLEDKEYNNELGEQYYYLTDVLNSIYKENNIKEDYNLVKILEILEQYNFLVKESNEWEVSSNSFKNRYCGMTGDNIYVITASGKNEIWNILKDYGVEKLSIYCQSKERIDIDNGKSRKYFNIEDIIIGVIEENITMKYKEAQKLVLSTMRKNNIITKDENNEYVTTTSAVFEEYCTKDSLKITEKIFTDYCKKVVVTVVIENLLGKGIEIKSIKEIKGKIKSSNRKEKTIRKINKIPEKDRNSITKIMNELIEEGKFPGQNYDWHKAMGELVKANLIIREEVGYVATEYALENNYYILRYYEKSGKPYYYISDEGRELVISILTSKDRDYYLKEDIEEVSNMGS